MFHKIEFPMDNKDISQGFFHIFYEILNTLTKNNPL